MSTLCGSGMSASAKGSTSQGRMSDRRMATIGTTNCSLRSNNHETHANHTTTHGRRTTLAIAAILLLSGPGLLAQPPAARRQRQP